MLETGDNGKPRKGRLEFNILPSFHPSQVLAGDGSSVGGLTPEMLGGKGGKFRLPSFIASWSVMQHLLPVEQNG